MNPPNTYKMRQAEIVWWNLLQEEKKALGDKFSAFWTDCAGRIGLPEVVPGMSVQNIEGVAHVMVPVTPTLGSNESEE